MDRKSIIGLVIIGAIFFAYMFYNNKTSKEQGEKIYTESISKGDSLLNEADLLYVTSKELLSKAKVETVIADSLNIEAYKQLPKVKRLVGGALNSYLKANKVKPEESAPAEKIKKIESFVIEIDELLELNKQDTACTVLPDGSIDESAQAVLAAKEQFCGKIDTIVLENELIKVNVSSLGGRVSSVQLKEYHPYNKDGEKEPLLLFYGDSNKFDLNCFVKNQKFSTGTQFFESSGVEESGNAKTLSMFFYADSSKTKYIEYKYSLAANSYMMDFDINIVGMNDVISRGNDLVLNWNVYTPSLEKGYSNENDYTGIYYKYFEDEVDYLDEKSDDDEELATPVKWIAFKQQFFSSVLIAKESFPSASIKQENLEDPKEKHLKHFDAQIHIPYTNQKEETIPFQFYFGPNHYKTLSNLEGDLDLERVIPLGWSFFLMQWINRFAVIPVFNFLEDFIPSYGIIILILTLLLKLVLFPLTYKSYVSQAKMRVVKPQLDKVLEKFPKEKMQERQQESMKFYKKVGVSPMGGCLPMLVQFPILISLFRFFPASIELRQKGFLWADDLSAYDSILDLPFDIPFYGDHVSLFTLLMTVSTILYTKMNSQMTSGAQMPGMKVMMYMMPVMFLFFFNNYASGLSYYYFVANIITFGQMFLIKRFFVNDDKILQKLEENKKKPMKKSKMQMRLEQAQKQRMQQGKKRK